jgi:hypothetical protein
MRKVHIFTNATDCGEKNMRFEKNGNMRSFIICTSGIVKVAKSRMIRWTQDVADLRYERRIQQFSRNTSKQEVTLKI